MKAAGTTATHDPIALDGTESTLGENGQETWYFVGANISHDGKISCYGAVNIILADDKGMAVSSAESGIWGDTGCTLTVYGQTNGTGTLNVSTTGTDATISHNGNVVISGGTVNATSTGNTSTAISAGGRVTINGGIVSAKGSTGMSATNGSITLGWMKADDSIYASSYSGTVTLAKAFIDDDDKTYESGTVSASAIAGKTLRPHVSIVSGDANGDGQVTLADAVAVVNHILGKTQENFNASNADVDGNGSITITDAVRIVGMLQHE
jgi:hypothetical protein